MNGTPGDALMIFREAIKQLESVRDSRPDDHDAIDAIVTTTAVALLDWAEARKNLRGGIS